jgi:hypothetical protein
MALVQPYADRVFAVADLESHITSQPAPEDAEKDQGEEKPRDFPAEFLFHAAATMQLMT